ncbi:dysbindin-like [Elysia marginata]|uniref:Dysbindin-like n=1 Tax=Elysia marginata TaxID=1093978 RepID=A0AAV4F9Y1_9GAST|nr:dysbindin-like [Elysia marginata]
MVGLLRVNVFLLGSNWTYIWPCELSNEVSCFVVTSSGSTRFEYVVVFITFTWPLAFKVYCEIQEKESDTSTQSRMDKCMCHLKTLQSSSLNKLIFYGCNNANHVTKQDGCWLILVYRVRNVDLCDWKKMSVLKKLRGTFQSAQQDIVEGLRALTSLDSQPRLDYLRAVKARDIDLDVGGDLLYNYQKLWNLIQTDTKESAAKAAEVNKLMAPMSKTWTRQAESINQLEEEVRSIPTLLTTLNQLQQLLDGLRQDFVAAEKGLDMLENMCEEQEHRKRIVEEEGKLAAYTIQREKEFEKLKVDLAHRHASKMAKVESAKRAQLQERAEAFTSAFKEDLEFYRTHGRPDRIPTEFPKVSSLSDIEIDQDKQALDSFLGPATESSNVQAAAASDDTYFEDDYITPFAVKEDADFVSDINHLTVPTKIDALSVESLEEDSGDEAKSKEAAESTINITSESRSPLTTDAKSEASEKTESPEGSSEIYSGEQENNAVEERQAE